MWRAWLGEVGWFFAFHSDVMDHWHWPDSWKLTFVLQPIMRDWMYALSPPVHSFQTVERRASGDPTANQNSRKANLGEAA